MSIHSLKEDRQSWERSEMLVAMSSECVTDGELQRVHKRVIMEVRQNNRKGKPL
jgi:hypothetical protein